MLTAYLDAVELRMNLGINAFMMTVTHTCRYSQLKGALQIFGVALSQSQRGGGLGRERLEWRQQVVFVGSVFSQDDDPGNEEEISQLWKIITVSNSLSFVT